jgi:predicted ATPase/DNA-binding XRE family transcriptional regulator/uncharacterized protein HemY
MGLKASGRHEVRGLEAMTTEQVLTFADALRHFRQQAGLTQEELAAQTGLGVRTISDLERGISRAPRLNTLTRLAKALDLPDEDRASFVAAARVKRPAQPPDRSPPPRPTQRALPTPLTPLIGREHEEASIVHLLQRKEVRLLTLTGAPGIGKTRLAIQVAEGMRRQFSDGVVFVELAPIRDSALVLPAVAQALGVRDTGTRPLREALTDYCVARQLLLVLDNFEQVLAAAVDVGELLAGCPGLKVLVTSRAALRLRAEQEFAVSPLTLPERTDTLPGLEDLSRYSAVALFVQRAQAAQPTFQLSAALASTVVEICRHLDGLPLAIELAAAHIKVLPPRALLARLERSLNVLVGGAQDLPERQRTLRGAIAWSHDLLTESEQRLFCRLSVFVGGWSLEAAETVGVASDGDTFPVLEVLGSLVDKSLVQVVDEREDGEEGARYSLLETLREYGLERLEASGEEETISQRHLHYFVMLAERAEERMRGPEQQVWLDRMEREHDNLRAALGRALERGDTEAGLRLTNGAWRFWHVRGHLAEGRKWLETFITLDTNQGKPRPVGAARAKAISYLGNLVFDQGDFAHAITLQEASLVDWRELGDRSGMAITLNSLANAVIYQGNYTRALALYEESLALRRELGDKYAIAIVLNNLGYVADGRGIYAQAEQYHQESLALWREFEDNIGIADSLQSLGELALHQGEYGHAQALLEECLTRSRDLKNKTTTAYCLLHLGTALMRQGEYTQAASLLEESRCLFQDIGDKRGVAYALLGFGDLAQALGGQSSAAGRYHESLTLFRALGSLEGIIDSLERLARIAKAEERWEDAISLSAAAAAARETLGTPVKLADRAEYERDLADLRMALGEKAFEVAWADGKVLSLDDALARVDEQAVKAHTK